MMLEMTVSTAFSNWNLNGHDAHDRSRNIITPSGGYDFQAQQSAETEQEQETHGTNAARTISEEGMGTKESKFAAKK
jgi:hypothetical protein